LLLRCGFTSFQGGNQSILFFGHGSNPTRMGNPLILRWRATLPNSL
jgi:hypothetical protein